MSLLGQLLLLCVFSLALGAVVSGYREDDPGRILRGTLRRALLFGGSVALLGGVALLLEGLFLRPGG